MKLKKIIFQDISISLLQEKVEGILLFNKSDLKGKGIKKIKNEIDEI